MESKAESLEDEETIKPKEHCWHTTARRTSHPGLPRTGEIAECWTPVLKPEHA